MAQCETCGNDYDKAFQVVMAGQTHVFDCFECAIQALAPSCAHCGCRTIGHGVEADGAIFCCAHCAREEAARGLRDRADAQRAADVFAELDRADRPPAPTGSAMGV
ncbi:MAG TPA: hypothetical protein VM490_23150 [Armatimonadaceae bacterium]|jgi:hypothetical protein|nr:hypothetical protein [Armatimonadaceae bacterium]